MNAEVPTKLTGRLRRNRLVHALWTRVKVLTALVRWNLRAVSDWRRQSASSGNGGYW